MRKVNVAVVGCGNISGIYLENLTKRFHNVQVYAVSDLIAENAKTKSELYGIAKILTFEEIIADPNVEIVLNLTTPPTHYSLCRRALEAGKHVYVEKPLSLTYAEGKALVSLAEERGLLLGCAPDTFLGAGQQTCRRIIEEGLLGDIIGATAFMVCHGHESWHPGPEFYYKKGGGPMFDMGPYYLTALVNMMGPVEWVSGMTAISVPTRTITSQPKYGQVIDVEVPTHVNGLLRFANGAIGNIITSFDVWSPGTAPTAGASAFRTWPTVCLPGERIPGPAAASPSMFWKSWRRSTPAATNTGRSGWNPPAGSPRCCR